MAAISLYKEVVNSISAHVAIIDEKGVILETNRAWDQFASENDMDQTFQSVGTNYLNICAVVIDEESDDGAEANEVARGIRGVLRGELSEFMTHYPCHSPEQKRWFVVRVVPLQEEQKAKAIVTHENITPIMEMQEALREKEAELLQEREKLEEAADAHPEVAASVPMPARVGTPHMWASSTPPQ